MTALWIVLGIISLLCFLAFLRPRVTLRYDGEISVNLRILFLHFRLYPRKVKVRLRDYRYRKFRKQKSKKTPPKQTQTKKEAIRTRSLKQSVRLYWLIFQKLYVRFLKYFRMDLSVLHITVATGDAANTALVTAAVSQTVAYLMEILRQHTNFHTGYRADVQVAPDFLSEKSRADCKITFSIAVWQIFSLGIRASYYFLKNTRIPRKNHD